MLASKDEKEREREEDAEQKLKDWERNNISCAQVKQVHSKAKAIVSIFNFNDFTVTTMV